jgi:hypothetical protein
MNLADRVCEHCGVPFQSPVFRVAQGRGRYCSVPCRAAARRTGVERRCVTCGRDFTARASRVAEGNGRYCSQRCSGIASRTTADDFWMNVAKGKPSQCWPWKASRMKAGYGHTTWQGRGHSASRVAYMLTHGPIAAGLQVCHRCDNAACCNPAHLYTDTPSGNNADLWARGRGRSGAALHPERLPRGEHHPNAKLTSASVVAIRAAHAEGVSTRELAASYGVSRDAIRLVVSRQRWTHV